MDNTENKTCDDVYIKKSLYENNYISKLNEEVTEFIDDIVCEIEKKTLNENDICEIQKYITTQEKMEKEILTYHLINYTPKSKITNFDEIIEFTIKMLKRYQYKVGGYDIEDKDWIRINGENNRFVLKKNQVLLYNSIASCDLKNETKRFMKYFTEYINRHFTGHPIKFKICENEKYKIHWIVIIFTKKIEKSI